MPEPTSLFDRLLVGLGLALAAGVVAVALLLIAGITRGTPGFGFTAVMTLIACGALIYVAARGVDLLTAPRNNPRPRKPSTRDELRRHRRTFEPNPNDTNLGLKLTDH